MSELTAILNQTIANRLKGKSEEEINAYKETIHKILSQAQTPQEAMGFSESFLEMIYDFGYQMFKSGHYDVAGMLFYLLVNLNPVNCKYLMAQAATQKKEGKWQAAIGTYMTVSYLDESDPLPFYFIGECLQALNGSQEELTLILSAAERRISQLPPPNSQEELSLAIQVALEKAKKGEKPYSIEKISQTTQKKGAISDYSFMTDLSA